MWTYVTPRCTIRYRLDGQKPTKDEGVLLKRGEGLELTDEQAAKFQMCVVEKGLEVDVLRSPVRLSGAWRKSHAD